MKNSIWKVVGFSLLFAGSGQWAVADEGDKRKNQVWNYGKKILINIFKKNMKYQI